MKNILLHFIFNLFHFSDREIEMNSEIVSSQWMWIRFWTRNFRRRDLELLKVFLSYWAGNFGPENTSWLLEVI